MVIGNMGQLLQTLRSWNVQVVKEATKEKKKRLLSDDSRSDDLKKGRSKSRDYGSSIPTFEVKVTPPSPVKPKLTKKDKDKEKEKEKKKILVFMGLGCHLLMHLRKIQKI